MLKSRPTASRPISIARKRTKFSVLYLLTGSETSKIHGVALNKKMAASHIRHTTVEECEIMSTDEMDILNECDDVKSGDTVYLIYHSKEFMGISKSLGNGVIDSHNKTPKYITNSLDKALAYISCNEEYASQYDEKLEMVKIVVL